MSYIICFAIIIVIAAMLAEILKKKIDLTIPIAVMGIVLTIYPFGFFQKLHWGVYAVCAIAIISIFYLIYKIVKNIQDKTEKEFIKRIFTPGLLVYIIFWSISIYLNRGRVLSSWDEFSHWGLIVKNMFHFDSYGTNPETTLLFRGYPPFTAIFEYFFLQMQQTFIEWDIIIAMNILYSSLLLPIFYSIDWKKGLDKLLIYVPLLFIVPTIFNKDFYTTIYVDTILGVFMAYILYAYFFYKEEKVKYISIGLGIIALPLIKSAGTGLAILILLIILVDLLCYKKINKTDKANRKKYILILGIILLCLLLGKYSWDIHLKINNTSEAWDTSSITFENIAKLLSGEGKEYQYTVIKNFIKNFFANPLDISIGSMTTLGLILVYILYSIFMISTIKKNGTDDPKRYKIVLLMLIICCVLYLLSLMILYIFTYSEFEAVKLAAYDRYSFIFLTGMFLFNTYVILKNFNGIKQDKQTAIILITILAMITSHYVINRVIHKDNFIETAQKMRNNYNDITKYESILTQKDKIYYVSCNSTGFDSHISRFNMIPYRVETALGLFGSWSLGKPRYEGDIWSLDIDIQSWNDILLNQGFTYVYIFKADEIFKQTYGELFENSENIKNKTLYRVEIEDNTVTLMEY